jgi:hypothetical protein
VAIPRSELGEPPPRKLRGSQRLVPVTGASTLIAGVAAHRRGIIVGNTDKNSGLWVSLGIPATVGGGLFIPPSTPFFPIYWPDNGQIAGMDLFAVSDLIAPPAGGASNLEVVGNALSGATTGVKLTLTVPAGVSATFQTATIFYTNLAPTVNLRLVRAATNYNLFSTAVGGVFYGPIGLVAADTVVWNVTTAVAASTFDAVISAVQTPLAGVSPTSINVLLWDLED